RRCARFTSARVGRIASEGTARWGRSTRGRPLPVVAQGPGWPRPDCCGVMAGFRYSVQLSGCFSSQGGFSAGGQGSRGGAQYRSRGAPGPRILLENHPLRCVIARGEARSFEATHHARAVVRVAGALGSALRAGREAGGAALPAGGRAAVPGDALEGLGVAHGDPLGRTRDARGRRMDVDGPPRLRQGRALGGGAQLESWSGPVGLDLLDATTRVLQAIPRLPIAMAFAPGLPAGLPMRRGDLRIQIESVTMFETHGAFVQHLHARTTPHGERDRTPEERSQRQADRAGHDREKRCPGQQVLSRRRGHESCVSILSHGSVPLGASLRKGDRRRALRVQPPRGGGPRRARGIASPCSPVSWRQSEWCSNPEASRGAGVGSPSPIRGWRGPWRWGSRWRWTRRVWRSPPRPPREAWALGGGSGPPRTSRSPSRRSCRPRPFIEPPWSTWPPARG